MFALEKRKKKRKGEKTGLGEDWYLYYSSSTVTLYLVEYHTEGDVASVAASVAANVVISARAGGQATQSINTCLGEGHHIIK